MAEIVIIDSEPTVRSVMSKILERAGHSVRATGEFKQALEILRVEKPDLVLTNVFLQGIPGHDAMARIREEFPDLPVLMVSGLPDEESIGEWSGAPKFDIFPKPFTAQSLIGKVDSLLNKKRSA